MYRSWIAGAAVILATLPAGLAWAADIKPMVTPGGETRMFYAETPLEILATAAETGGQFGIVGLYEVPGGGPGQAVVEDETQTFYVLEGDFTFTIAGQAHEVGPGSIIINPPLAPMTFINSGTTPGRLLLIFTPGGGEEIFVDLGTTSQRSESAIARLKEQFGIDR